MSILLDKLAILKNQYGLCAVKTDLESENVSIDMMQELRQWSSELGLKYVVKIGGCGSIKDLLLCKFVDADIVVAPMIESNYALKKFVQCVEEVYSDTQKPSLHLNIETITGVRDFDKIIFNQVGKFSGVVFGRSDYNNSLVGSVTDSNEVFDVINQIKIKAFNNAKDFIIGGSLSINSIPYIEKVKPTYVETRNLVFKPVITEATINNYLEFEILWLSHKKDIIELDKKRLEVLKTRTNKVIYSV